MNQLRKLKTTQESQDPLEGVGLPVASTLTEQFLIIRWTCIRCIGDRRLEQIDSTNSFQTSMTRWYVQPSPLNDLKPFGATLHEGTH